MSKFLFTWSASVPKYKKHFFGKNLAKFRKIFLNGMIHGNHLLHDLQVGNAAYSNYETSKKETFWHSQHLEGVAFIVEKIYYRY